MSGVPKVALLIETSREYGRGVLRGIVRYARLHGPWAFYITPGDFEQALPKMEQWGGTGIIARIATPKVAKAILATGLPLVALDLSEKQLAANSPLSKVCEIISDSYHASQLAANHLLERGFPNYAFVGIADRVWSTRRRDSFIKHVTQAGYNPHVYEPPKNKHEREWGREQKLMAEWLRNLPKPVGLMACNDDRGRDVLEACRAANLSVPEEMAVIGVDNDSLLCELANPPLSSVMLNAEHGGFEAAALLDRLMSGRSSGQERIVVEPLQVVTRRSTDVVALEDIEVAHALQFIHENAGRPIQVTDIINALGISRRTLEIRFRRAIGKSMNEKIQQAHLERAKRLLLETDLPLPKVANAAGFNSTNYLTVVFHKAFAMTPAKFRNYVRNR
ncbi:MAG: DNA-binding transcriptional regulator [Thermoguttaceae bacterium]|jgi:LacI family transcriptional regulator